LRNDNHKIPKTATFKINPRNQLVHNLLRALKIINPKEITWKFFQTALKWPASWRVLEILADTAITGPQADELILLPGHRFNPLNGGRQSLFCPSAMKLIAAISLVAHR